MERRLDVGLVFRGRDRAEKDVRDKHTTINLRLPTFPIANRSQITHTLCQHGD